MSTFTASGAEDVLGPGASGRAPAAPGAGRSRLFPWIVFALTFGLLLSDYMSRQVIAAVFPVLKVEWGLTDTALATLNSVVSLSVAVFAIPLSVLGDRVGRSRSVIAMAVVWSVATLASGLAASYGQVLVARFVVGVGEAAYGSIGLAVLLSVFSPARRSTLTATFLAGASVGSVLGVVVGGAAAQAFGWRAAFVVLGVVGLVLTGFYALAVTEPRIRAHAHPADDVHAAAEGASRRATFATLVSTPAVHAAYIASGLQLLTVGALYAWLPSFFDRAYGLPTAKASGAAGLFIGIIAVGMVTTGALTDRVSARHPIRKWAASAGFVALGALGLGVAFRMPPGPAQLVVLGIGAFFCAGIAGPAGAMVASLTSPSVRATAFATLSLANNLLGLAAGPVVVGALADRVGLVDALAIVPFVSIVVLISLAIGRATYERSLVRVGAGRGSLPSAATPGEVGS